MNSELVKEAEEVIRAEIIACVESGIYPTVSRYAKDETGIRFITKYVINLTVNEDQSFSSGIAQFESSF